MQADFLEIKRHKNKPDQQFRCTLLHREPDHAVLHYFSEKPGLIADISIAAGSTTVAWYWTHRPYAVWRMFDRNACLIGTLFHICTDIQIYDDHLSYTDLLLDIWVAPDSSLRILDGDEVLACAATGLITDDELRHIRHAQYCVTTGHVHIIAALVEFENNNRAAVFPESAPDVYSS